MNEERLKTNINLFNSCESIEELVKGIIAMSLLIDTNDIDRIMADINANTLEKDSDSVRKLKDLLTNNKRINVDEIQKMIISLAALFISLHKESILEKDMSDKSLSLLVNKNDYDAVITYIAKERNNKYYITNIEFDTSLECLDFVRNKLLHGDYHIKDDHIYLEKDGKVGSISYQRLIDMSLNLNKLKNCKDKTYTVQQVMLSPFEGLVGEPKNPLAERLFEATLSIRVKGKRKINSNIINLLDEIAEYAFELNVNYKVPVGVAIEKAIIERQEDISRLKCEVTYTSDFYLKNPISAKVIHDMDYQLKLINDKERLKNEDYLNFLTTNSYCGEIEHMNEAILGLTRLLLLLTPTAVGRKIKPHITIGEFSEVFNRDIPMSILKFYCYYNYGLDAIFSSGVNTNLKDIVNGNNFDYSIMDLTLFDDPNMTTDFKLNNYQDQLNAMINDEAALNQSLQTKQANYQKFKQSSGANNQAAEQRILASLQATQDALTNVQTELYKAQNLNVSKYERNLNIINHIRNSIAHGHYKIDDTNPREIYFVFDDIYQGVTTYHLRIKKTDFDLLFNYKSDIKKYLDNLSNKYLTKSSERIHYEDILLNCRYVYPVLQQNWNTLVENTLDMNNQNELDKLIFAYEIMREITLSSMYTNNVDDLAEATRVSFNTFMAYACVDFKESFCIYGRTITKEEYKEVIELVLNYCEVITEYNYIESIKDFYLPNAVDGSVLKEIYKNKTLT